jgi:hypothetical protein
MKISEMNNEQAIDMLVRISTPLGNICDDEQIADILKRYQELEEMPFINAIGKFLPEIVACAFKKHKDDLFEIIGALTLQKKEKAAKMNFVETLKIIREALNDEDLSDFFTSFKGRMRKNVTESAQG